MPPEEEEAAPEEIEVKKKSSGGLKTIITIAVILLLSCAAGLVMTKLAVLPRLGASGSGELVGDEEVPTTETPEKRAPGGAPIYYDPIELIVNIEDKGIDRFLIVEMSLQLESESLKRELASIDPKVRDRFISVLRSKTYDDLKGPKGQDKLSRELVESVNTLLESGRVVAADLTKLQVQ
jgi:flagellar FliL protein